MHQIIIKNLFEFIRIAGQANGFFTDYGAYQAALNPDSDWPNRIFFVEENKDTLEEIITGVKAHKLPNSISLDAQSSHVNDARLKLRVMQTTMALDLKNKELNSHSNTAIIPVQTLEDANAYGYVASVSFNYRLEGEKLFKAIQSTDKIQSFIYKENGQCLGTGTLFIDSDNVAGLHTITTHPAARGKAIGTQMTQFLIQKSIENQAEICTLQASAMGEPIYKKLGFKIFGELKTFRIIT